MLNGLSLTRYNQKPNRYFARVRPCVNCILTFSLWIAFVRIEPLEKHVIQWLQVGSVSIAYDSDYSSSGNCSFRLFCIAFTRILIHPVFPYGKSPHAVDTRPKSEVFFKWAEARRSLSITVAFPSQPCGAKRQICPPMAKSVHP